MAKRKRNKHNLSPEAMEARRQYHKNWRARNPDYDRKWRQESNPESFQQSQEKYIARKIEEDPDWKSKKLKKFRELNPDKQMEYDKRKWEKKAEQMQNEITVTENKITVTDEPGQKICEICGRFFIPKRSTAVYCGDTCRQRACRAKRRALT